MRGCTVASRHFGNAARVTEAVCLRRRAQQTIAQCKSQLLLELPLSSVPIFWNGYVHYLLSGVVVYSNDMTPILPTAQLEHKTAVSGVDFHQVSLQQYPGENKAEQKSKLRLCCILRYRLSTVGRDGR